MAEEGRTIADRYELVAVLGEGGMGVVWRARDTRLGRAVAVKVLSASSIGNSIARSRLIREARAAAALEHDGIIRVYDVGETDDGGAFLVMELIRGCSLRDALVRNTITLSERVEVIVEAARALAFAHAAGIVHRDIKPDNIMIREDGRVTLVDFGVAKPVATELLANAETLAGVTNTNLTGMGQLVGTPAYLAPEQARGVEISSATDQFALAVTAHEALCGQLPWTGSGVIEVVASLLRDTAPPISSQSPVPPLLDPVLSRALEKEPKDRWPDMNAFADALEAAAKDMSSNVSSAASSIVPARNRVSTRPKATPPDPGKPTPPAEVNVTKISAATALPSPTASTHSPHSATPEPIALRPARSRTAAFAVLAVSAIAVGGFFVVRSRTETSVSPTASAMASANAAGTVVACPPFAVTGEEQWLGGAAASLACERYQISHGGLDARTLMPGELLGASREIGQTSPLDLIESATARDRGMAAAKERAARWLDGKIDKKPGSYTATIVLRSRDGGEIAHGEGNGPELFEAIRDALKPIDKASGPLSPEDTAMLRDWLDVESVDQALDLLDVQTATLIEDPVSLKEACAAVARRTDLAPRVAYLTKAVCARKLRTGMAFGEPPALDESTPGRLITTALAQGSTGGAAAVKERAQKLEQLREKTTSIEGQARLAAAAAELYNSVGDARARQIARTSVQASPKAFDWRTSSWHRVAFSSEGGAGLGGALAAWHPWEPVAQSLRVERGGLADPLAVEKYLARSYVLSQRGYYASGYADQLLNIGKLEAARGIADQTKDDLLRVKLIVAEAKYKEAFAEVPRLLAELPATEEKASLAFQLTMEGARVGLILGRTPDFVDAVVTRYLMSEPHHVVDGVIPFMSLVSACCFAPHATGKRCIDRIQQLRSDGKLPTIFSSSEVVIAGAARFVADDYAGAAKAWRTMLRSAGWIQDPLREAMAIAFERSGAPDLAEEVDQVSLALIDLPRTADLAWVRGAKRAQLKGDNARARKLAQAVLDKWRFADEDLPAMKEMKQLLAKLPP